MGRFKKSLTLLQGLHADFKMTNTRATDLRFFGIEISMKNRVQEGREGRRAKRKLRGPMALPP